MTDFIFSDHKSAIEYACRVFVGFFLACWVLGLVALFLAFLYNVGTALWRVL